jgi:hypothetical protein
VTRLELPDGGWAVLCSPRKVQERKRRRYIAAMTDMNVASELLPQIPNPRFGEPGQPATTADFSKLTGDMMQLSDRVGDMLILCLVKEWSFGDVNEETLQTLDSDCFDVLYAACLPLAGELVPNYSPDPDPKASTPGSLVSHPGSSPVPLTSETRLSAVTS